MLCWGSEAGVETESERVSGCFKEKIQGFSERYGVVHSSVYICLNCFMVGRLPAYFDKLLLSKSMHALGILFL